MLRGTTPDATSASRLGTGTRLDGDAGSLLGSQLAITDVERAQHDWWAAHVTALGVLLHVQEQLAGGGLAATADRLAARLAIVAQRVRWLFVAPDDGGQERLVQLSGSWSEIAALLQRVSDVARCAWFVAGRLNPSVADAYARARTYVALAHRLRARIASTPRHRQDDPAPPFWDCLRCGAPPASGAAVDVVETVH